MKNYTGTCLLLFFVGAFIAYGFCLDGKTPSFTARRCELGSEIREPIQTDFDDVTLNGKHGSELWNLFNGFENETIGYDLPLDVNIPNLIPGKWYKEQFSGGDIEIVDSPTRSGRHACKLTAPQDTGNGAYAAVCRGWYARKNTEIDWGPDRPQVAWDAYFCFPSETWDEGDWTTMFLNAEVFTRALKSYAGALLLTHIRGEKTAWLSVWNKTPANFVPLAKDIPLRADAWYYVQLVVDTEKETYVSVKIRGQGVSRVFAGVDIPCKLVTSERPPMDYPLIAFYLNANSNAKRACLYFDDTLARFPKHRAAN